MPSRATTQMAREIQKPSACWSSASAGGVSSVPIALTSHRDAVDSSSGEPKLDRRGCTIKQLLPYERLLFAPAHRPALAFFRSLLGLGLVQEKLYLSEQLQAVPFKHDDVVRLADLDVPPHGSQLAMVEVVFGTPPSHRVELFRGLVQPVRHTHVVVHRRRGGEVLAGLLTLACPPIEPAKAEMAVGDFGAHPELHCQRESLLKALVRASRVLLLEGLSLQA